jgi:microcystin degradation protein MlrC
MMRVAIGGISHETNTFSSISTDLALFQRRTLLRGEALLAGSRGVGNTLGGMVDAAEALGWQLVPTLFASAVPSGRVRRGTFETLTEELVRGIAAARQHGLDGVLLALHGAMVAEAVEDADAEVLRRARRAAGPDTPIVVVFDSHANLTPAIVDHADLVLGFKTYPHIDTYARGTEAATLLERLHRGAIRPVRALRQVPMLVPLPAQRTEGPTPMRDLLRLVTRLEGLPGILSITLAGGFPYSDVHDAGLAVVVTSDDDRELAERIAEDIARACWERREHFRPELTPIDEALAIARRAQGGAGPVVLADVADNPGAGAAGDGTAILDALLRAGIAGVAVGVLADAESVARARAIGAGGRGRFHLGGKVDHLHGPTLDVEARVRFVGEVTFTNRGPMGTGARTRLGRTTVLEVSPPHDAMPTGQTAPVEVIVSEQRVQVLDPELFRAAGIQPEQRRVLVVKSSVHYRAAFEPLASVVIDVDGPGLSSPDLRAFPYRNVRRPIWPLD